MATCTRAEGDATDHEAGHRDEVGDARQCVVTRAWTDARITAELIADPHAVFVHRAGHDHMVELYDDRSASSGDRSSTGEGQRATWRGPTPLPPAGGEVSDADLAAVGGAGDNCCCRTGLCCCTGAPSHDTRH